MSDVEINETQPFHKFNLEDFKPRSFQYSVLWNKTRDRVRENSYVDEIGNDIWNSSSKLKMNPNVLRKRAMNWYWELLELST